MSDNKKDRSKYAAEDVTPTWSEMATAWERLLPSMNQTGAVEIWTEIKRMAQIADMYVEHQKQDEHLIELETACNHFLYWANDSGKVVRNLVNLEEFLEASCEKLGVDYVETDWDEKTFLIETGNGPKRLYYYEEEEEEEDELVIPSVSLKPIASNCR